jgi:hypothetical protein
MFHLNFFQFLSCNSSLPKRHILPALRSLISAEEMTGPETAMFGFLSYSVAAFFGAVTDSVVIELKNQVLRRDIIMKNFQSICAAFGAKMSVDERRAKVKSLAKMMVTKLQGTPGAQNIENFKLFFV